MIRKFDIVKFDSNFKSRKFTKKSFVITLCLLFTIMINAQIRFEQGSWDEIIEKAKTENKLIFISLYSEWAGPCKWMDKNVYNKSDIGLFYNSNFFNVEVDSQSPFGISIREIHNLKNVPSFLFIDSDENEIYKLQGKIEFKKFIDLGKVAIRMNHAVKKDKKSR